MKAKKCWMLTAALAIFLAGFLTVRVFATLKNDQRSLVEIKGAVELPDSRAIRYQDYR